MPLKLPYLNQQDPWRDNKSSNSGSPPDLEAIFANLLKKVKNKPTGTGSSSNGSGASQNPMMVFKLVAIALLFIWFLSGIYVVKQAEQGVVLRFGRYVRSVGPGLHWVPPIIERRIVMNVEQISQFQYSAQMLTKDENIVSVEMSVQYRIGDLSQYLFNVKNPLLSLNEATASALRQVVGHTKLDELLTTGREGVRDQVSQQLKKIMDFYQTGLLVTKVSLLPAKPPEEVTEAFNDAIKAREDEQRYINQANAYASKVVPIAKGQAARLVASAQAMAEQAVLRAQGDTARFLALLPQFRRAPAVMRERMYLDAMQHVLSRSTKVLVDMKGNNVFYLPFDKLMQRIHQSAHQRGSAPIEPLTTSSTQRDSSAESPNQSELPTTQRTMPVDGSYGKQSMYSQVERYGHVG